MFFITANVVIVQIFMIPNNIVHRYSWLAQTLN